MVRPEVRLDRMRAAEVRAAMAAAPIAWVPWGALEYHAEHLPYGTDGFAAQHLLERAARRAGGVVLPWTALTIGTLHLEWTFRYEAALIEEVLRQTILQLAAHGARVVIVLTGHGPLDLDHLIKRVCAEAEATGQLGPDFRAYGLCYLELNAALGTGLGTDWPVAIDHGSVVETSWMMALEPGLVALDRLPEDPAATGIVGVYGPNPRDLAGAPLGEDQIEACAALLTERATLLLAGGRLDTMADLRSFVERYWPEPLELSGRAGAAGTAALLVRNPGAVSRYLSGVSLRLDAADLSADGIGLLNVTPGEIGVPVTASSLGPETGFYVRRGQSAELRLPIAVGPGPHRVDLSLGLAGVTQARLEHDVVFA